MKIKPLLNRVVIEQDAVSEKTEGGLMIPDSAKEKPLSGKIVAKGDKANLVEVGDSILYQKYRGTEIIITGREYMIMQQEDILAVLDEKDKINDCNKKEATVYNWISSCGFSKMASPENKSIIYESLPISEDDYGLFNEMLSAGTQGNYLDNKDVIYYKIEKDGEVIFNEKVSPIEIIWIETLDKNSNSIYNWYFKGQFELFTKVYNSIKK